MKKILLLATLLSSVVLANNEATMNITANVIKPLTVVKEEDLNFGRIIQGQDKIARADFVITGEENDSVIVNFEGAEFEGDNAIVYLNSNKESAERLRVFFGIQTETGHQQGFIKENSTVYLGSKGSVKLGIDARTDKTTNKHYGDYTGAFTLKARYQ